MYDLTADIFENYKTLIIFLHVLSASFLIGSMFVIIFIVRPIAKKVEDIELKCENCLKILQRFNIFLVPIMLTILSASFFMNIGMGFEYGDPTVFIVIHIKEAIWIFLAFNFLYIYKKYMNAKKAYRQKDFLVTQENIILITKYLIPLNLVISLIAVYFGVVIKEI
ncbi:MAG: hypothetical protein QM482_09435 [Sulfurospirillum sp.]